MERKTAVAAIIAAVLFLFGSVADARPGTPTHVRVDPCTRWEGIPPPNLGPPTLCVEFRNSATEEVRFDVEITADGVPGKPPGSRVGCFIPTGPGYDYQCTAGNNLMGGRATTRVGQGTLADWAPVIAATPAGWGLGALPDYHEQLRRSQERDPVLQGFYLTNLAWDTDYCFRFRARNAGDDRVSKLWSAWDCERTAPAPPNPAAPQVSVAFNELRGTLSVAWTAGTRIGYYTIEASSSAEKLTPEVSRLLPPEARGPVNGKRITDTGLEINVPYGLARAMEGEEYYVRVCAVNLSGKGCSGWASSTGSNVPRNALQKKAEASGPVSVGAQAPVSVDGVKAADVSARPTSIDAPSSVQVAIPRGAIPDGTPRCKPGFVHRQAGPADHVCVTPASRDLAARERVESLPRHDSGGAYGPNTCKSGYVWREAFAGDTVCVVPGRRTAVRQENDRAAENRL